MTSERDIFRELKCRLDKRHWVGGYPDMIVDPQFRKCVGFLAVDDPEYGKRPCATAFFVLIEPPKVFGPQFVYAITARHVLDWSRPKKMLYLGLNKKDGEVEYRPVPQDDWTPHLNTDVAAIEIDFCEEQLDHTRILKEALFSLGDSSKPEINVGTELVMIGLFKKFHGQEHLQPVIRFGKISGMPDEKVPLQLTPEGTEVLVEAYLIESLSWGGESGSPVFTYGLNQIFATPGVPMSLQLPRVIGLLHGHYQMEEAVEFQPRECETSGTVNLNSGMAVVIPAHKILELLDYPDFLAKRNRVLEESKKSVSVPKPDSDLGSDRPFTKQDFERALKKVSRRVRTRKTNS